MRNPKFGPAVWLGILAVAAPSAAAAGACPAHTCVCDSLWRAPDAVVDATVTSSPSADEVVARVDAIYGKAIAAFAVGTEHTVSLLGCNNGAVTLPLCPVTGAAAVGRGLLLSVIEVEGSASVHGVVVVEADRTIACAHTPIRIPVAQAIAALQSDRCTDELRVSQPPRPYCPPDDRPFPWGCLSVRPWSAAGVLVLLVLACHRRRS
jgi:hypothetical protein